MHQFEKVEIVQVTRPEDSYAILEEMVAYVEGLVQALELPYRIVRLCGGDLGFASAMTYDFEVWSAGQERWLEISSVSNFETFQSNRLRLRYADADDQKALAHTLNGSALAFGAGRGCLAGERADAPGHSHARRIAAVHGFRDDPLVGPTASDPWPSNDLPARSFRSGAFGRRSSKSTTARGERICPPVIHTLRKIVIS